MTSDPSSGSATPHLIRGLLAAVAFAVTIGISAVDQTVPAYAFGGAFGSEASIWLWALSASIIAAFARVFEVWKTSQSRAWDLLPIGFWAMAFLVVHGATG